MDALVIAATRPSIEKKLGGKIVRNSYNCVEKKYQARGDISVIYAP